MRLKPKHKPKSAFQELRIRVRIGLGVAAVLVVLLYTHIQIIVKRLWSVPCFLQTIMPPGDANLYQITSPRRPMFESGIVNRASLAELFINHGYVTGIEVGVADGRFAEHMLLSCLSVQGFHWYLVEPYVNGALQKRLLTDWSVQGVSANRFTVYPYTSLARETVMGLPVVDLVYLDGLHTYNNVIKELFWYWPKVRPGGMMAGHDFCSSNSSLDAPKCGLYTEFKGDKKDTPVASQDDVVGAVYEWLQYHPGLELRWTSENFTRESLSRQGYDYDLVLTSTRNPSWFIYRPPKLCGGRVLRNGVISPAPDCPNTLSNGSCGSKVLMSIVLLYYGEADELRKLLRLFATSWDDELKHNVRIVVVDDGASTPAAPIASEMEDDLQLCVASVLEDIPWNIGGARNLGVYVSQSDYVFFMDIDCWPTPNLVNMLLDISSDPHAPDVLMDFPRTSNGIRIHPHPASMLIRVATYWHVGGCDEDFVGRYGYTDVHLKHRLHAYNKLSDTSLTLTIRSMSNVSAATLETDYRSIPRDSGLNKKLFEYKMSGIVPWSEDMLRFQWTVRQY